MQFLVVKTIELKFNLISKNLLLLLFMLFSFNTNLYSQSYDTLSYITIKESLDKRYGMDPSLYNGILYQSFYPNSVKGNQYLSSPEFVKSEAIIRGIHYKNIDLNYDIYKQELLLRYLNASNSYTIISLSKAWLEGFSIEKKRFVIHSTSEAPNRFYQVLGNSSILLFYFHKKELKVDNSDGVLNFYPQKLKFVFMDHSLKKFRTNRDFLHLFPRDKQIQIRKYMKQNKIKVLKASDKIMEELIDYCSKLDSM